MAGRFCRVEPLDPARHARRLFAANSLDGTGATGPICSSGAVRRRSRLSRLAEQMATGDDPLFHAIVDRETGKAVGVAAFMRIDRATA